MSVFNVHSCHVDQVWVEAVTPSGRVVQAQVPAVIVELVPHGHVHGTVTRRYVPDTDQELSDLLDKYKSGSRILVTTTVIEQDAPEPEDNEPQEV